MPALALYDSSASERVTFSAEQPVAFDWVVMLPTAKITMPARMPRITITISISTRVKPASTPPGSIRFSRFTSPLLLREQARGVEHAVHGRDEGHCDEPHDQAHEQDTCRLDQAGQLLELVLGLPAVVPR